MTIPPRLGTKTRFVVCEDGNEYLERFERFLSTDYEFVQARCLTELLSRLSDAETTTAILLDLDFRRTDVSLLVDGEGHPLADASLEERKRLVKSQGIAILACLRRAHTTTRVLLFADLPEAQSAFIEQRFAPLTIVPSHVSMRELQVELEALALGSQGV